MDMKTVNEVSKLSGVSVQTLHYYDEIGLLTPQKSDHSGYRLYDEKDIESLQQILFFRELGFELKKIKEILDKPNFDKDQALKNHKDLLLLKRTRLDNLIELTENLLKGENKMSFKEFDMAEIENAQKKTFCMPPTALPTTTNNQPPLLIGPPPSYWLIYLFWGSDLGFYIEI